MNKMLDPAKSAFHHLLFEFVFLGHSKLFGQVLVLQLVNDFLVL